MIETKDLTLVVKKQELGELITNANEIKTFVETRLKDYTPENYVGKVEDAKKDRAELNKASKELNAKRLELEKLFMKPFDEFKGIIKETTTAIDGASKKLDEIVKGEEEREKDEKRGNLTTYFNTKNFTLLPFEKIFQDRWLNKTAKHKEVYTEIDDAIEKIYREIKTLEALEDADVLKQLYLDTLDIGAAIRKGEELKEYREKLAAEAKERAERETTAKMQAQQQELAKEEISVQNAAPMATLAAQAAGIEPDADPVMEYTLKFKAKRSVLFALRQYMTDNKIVYEKIEGDTNGK